MSLFIVRHEHAGDGCPVRDPFQGAALLNHLSRASARRHGITIHGEAMARGQHIVYFIAEAAEEVRLLEFLAPLRAAGTLEVIPASTCAHVVASGGCGALPPVSPGVPALNPEAACQRAIADGLVLHRAHPLNCETSIPALVGGVVMPSARFYVRNNFQIPQLDRDGFRLQVSGLVARSLSLSLQELCRLPTQSLVVTLECAGNGRSGFDPPTDGEKWHLGAVSTAEWTGVPLVEVLDRAGPTAAARHVVFRGADSGLVEGRPEPDRFERGLALDQARMSEALLAYAMNGEPLPLEHGFPLRLIVPGWYAVASVKWLTEIELTDRPLVGRYQTERYVYYWQREEHEVSEPVTLQRVRALITDPTQGQTLVRGELALRGVAWSGAAPIARVEVSLDDGPWHEARLVGERRRHSWQWWELIRRVDTPGRLTIRARATDMAGRTQPEQPEWNRLGYGNNAIQSLTVDVT